MSEPTKAAVSIPLAPTPGPVASGLKKDTARITVLPRAIPAPVLEATRSAPAFDQIPTSYCWAIFSLAALIFLIQIWNYVVS
jgi:hypothetical protein